MTTIEGYKYPSDPPLLWQLFLVKNEPHIGKSFCMIYWNYYCYMWHKRQQVLRREDNMVPWVIQGSPNALKSSPDAQNPKRHHRVTVFKPLLHLTCHHRGSKAADFMFVRHWDAVTVQSNLTFHQRPSWEGILWRQLWQWTCWRLGATSSPASHLAPPGTFQSSTWCRWPWSAARKVCRRGRRSYLRPEGRSSAWEGNHTHITLLWIFWWCWWSYWKKKN